MHRHSQVRVTLSIMSSHDIPRRIGYLALFQVLNALAILTLTCWSLTHRGWWTDMTTPAALLSTSFTPIPPGQEALALSFRSNKLLSVASSVLTAVLHPLGLYWHYSWARCQDPWRPRSQGLYLQAFYVINLLALWMSAWITTIRNYGKDYRYALDEPPYDTWWTGVGLAFLEL